MSTIQSICPVRSQPVGAGLNKTQLKPRYIGKTEKPERGDNAGRGTKGKSSENSRSRCRMDIDWQGVAT